VPRHAVVLFVAGKERAPREHSNHALYGLCRIRRRPSQRCLG
jgi:hypothetical protein